MTIECRTSPDGLEFLCRGSLSAGTVGSFRAAAERILAQPGGDVLLRLDGLVVLDSSGVGAIVFLHRRLALQGRRLRVSGLAGEPLALARLIRLDHALGCGAAEVAGAVPRRGLLARLAGLLRPAPARDVEV